MPSAASTGATSVSAAAHAFGHREFRFGACRRRASQRRLGVFADRNRLDVAGRDLAVAGELGEVEAGPIFTLSILESFGAISTMLLPSRLTRVGSLMFFCLIA